MDSSPPQNKTVSSNEGEESSPLKNKQNKNRGKKRKRISSDSSSDNGLILVDNALVTEKNVHESAVKNNLDDISVRKILKKVVTNDHVLALVKLREEEEDSEPENKNVAPKLTRAKVKELKKVSPKSAAWNLENLELTPINHIPVKTRPEVKALIAQELPEDEDDDEYEPTNDDVPSDDDHVESCSDLESQPRTPAALAASPALQSHGPFKVPQDVSSVRRKLDIEEEATIALRTRSKLSLSSTSIEHIESRFVPPDDLPVVDVDDVWNEFLNECLNPLSTSKNEDDDEADPEYNAAADPDANDEDDIGTVIKISKRELNDLVTELFSVVPEGTQEAIVQDLANSLLTDNNNVEIPQWEGKQEPTSDEDKNTKSRSQTITFEKQNTYSRLLIGKTESPDDVRQNNTENNESTQHIKVENDSSHSTTPPSIQLYIEEQNIDCSISDNPPSVLKKRIEPVIEAVHISIDNSRVVMTHEQRLILEQQLRQHIQLATGNYLQLYVHPTHWAKAPVYKDYLVTLYKLGQSNSKSVVNVCNLQPAMELITSWETTVSDDTEENRAMIEFINKEIERCNRRYYRNSLYLGEFHETFKKIVANSSVFLYPYLLPAMPYREHHVKRYGYLHSEDELIVLGLDQFSRYLESNPSLARSGKHPRHRTGLRAAVSLTVKHLLPFTTEKRLHSHIASMRAHGDKNNPIRKYLERNEINPVQHKILPFNPKITLYEQPEHEMPKIWVRYLAKTSTRFKRYLYRRKAASGIEPTGVPVISITPEATVKQPLPIDFTKKIQCIRTALKDPQENIPNKYDIQIQNAQTNPNGEIKPVLTATNLFKLVQTSTGTVLVPLEITSDCNIVNNTNVLQKPPVEKAVKNKAGDIDDHCTCCVLLRKICKKKQTYITDYFSNKSAKKCYCDNIKYPKISHKLRLLVNNFKSKSEMMYNNVERMLETGNYDKEKYSFDEFAAATSYHIKMTTYISTSKRLNVKTRVKTLFSRFDLDSDDPVKLANDLSTVYDSELHELYTEFLEFLTPAQADVLHHYKDYFVRNCVKDLLEKIHEQVKNEYDRNSILDLLKTIFGDKISTACEICTYLLQTMTRYSTLAQYTFNMFPHRKADRLKRKHAVIEDVLNNMNNLASNSETQINEDSLNSDPEQMFGENNDPEEDLQQEFENDVDMDSQHEYPSNIDIEDDTKSNITIVEHIEQTEGTSTSLEDEIKKEPTEWTRDEDRLILQVLKQELTLEQMKEDTILQTFETSNCCSLISESLTNKSLDEIKKRVAYLLSVLVGNDET